MATFSLIAWATLKMTLTGRRTREDDLRLLRDLRPSASAVAGEIGEMKSIVNDLWVCHTAAISAWTPPRAWRALDAQLYLAIGHAGDRTGLPLLMVGGG